MFNLDKEIKDWCLKVLGRDTPKDLRTELEDHLHCEVENLKKAGFSEEQAFKCAVYKMGEPKGLLQEFSKNKGLLSRLWRYEKNLNRAFAKRFPMSSKTRSRLIIGNALFFAASLFVLAWLFKDNEKAYMWGHGIMLTGWAFLNGLLAASQKPCKPKWLTKLST